MPVIPFIQSERTFPGTAGGNFLPSENPVNEALVRSGQQIAATSDRFMTSLTQQKQWEEAQKRQYDERMKRAAQHVEASKHENYLKDWVNQKTERLRGRVDYENFDTQAEADGQELQGYIDKIDDLEVRMAVEAGAQTIFHSLNSQYKVKKAAVLTDVGKAELDRSLDRDRKEWVQATSESDSVMQTQVNEEGLIVKPTERDIIKARMQARIEASLNSGILKPSEAVNMVQRLDSALEEVYAEELQKTDPYRLLAELNDKTKLTNLDPVNKRPELVKSTVTEIEKREREAEKRVKADQEEAEQQVMDLLDKNDLVGAESLLANLGLRRLLPPDKRRVLGNAITSARKEDKSDQAAYYDLETQVLIGKAGQSEILKALNVSVEDKNKLLRLLNDDKDVRKSYDYVEAMKSAHNEIITTGPLAALDPEMESRFTAYKRAAEKHIRAGGDPWEFYDKNVWKYRAGVSRSKYGTPTSIEEINAMAAKLRDDVANKTITVQTANLEAEKLKAARGYFVKRDQGKKNANPSK